MPLIQGDHLRHITNKAAYLSSQRATACMPKRLSKQEPYTDRNPHLSKHQCCRYTVRKRKTGFFPAVLEWRGRQDAGTKASRHYHTKLGADPLSSFPSPPQPPSPPPLPPDLPIKSSRSHECRVQQVCSVSSCQEHHPSIWSESIHLSQQLVQGLLPFLIGLTSCKGGRGKVWVSKCCS